jgi:hypothetical protein
MFSRDTGFVMDVLRTGANRGREVTERTKEEILTGLGIFRL